MADIISSIVSFFQTPLVQKIIWAAVIAIVTGVVSRIVTQTIERIIDLAQGEFQSTSLVINIFRGIVWVCGGSAILGAFGIDMSGIVTALGVGGVALSLGLQDTLSNFIGGLQVTFMRIVEPGDNILVDGTTGVVQDITWRQTTIKDAVGQEIIIPNSVMSSSSVTKLLPAERVIVPFVISKQRSEELMADPDALDSLVHLLTLKAMTAASAVSALESGPTVTFSEITEWGIKGKVIFTVTDVNKTFASADAVVRAIAPDLQ